MTGAADLGIDPSLDLVLERWVDVPPDLVWAAWTEPRHLKKWFTPAPFTTPECDIDLRPGGRFRVVMRSPEGNEMQSEGCYLEVTPRRRLIWTGALAPGYRPAAALKSVTDFPFTAVILLEPQGTGTRYTAIAMHRDPEDRGKHEAMGFVDGWGKALDQLVTLMRSEKRDTA